ncbi:MAG TPA: FAD-binding protein [Thermoplasmatales archaeon]|nr:FAD-binding protein [Thermoplasmatales archaeon]
MKTDVVIVGAGPAGSIAAKTLAEKNINVLLIEKKKFPRDKPCGGGLPIRVIKRFPWIKNIGVIESYSYGGHVHSESLHYKAESPESKPVIAMVQRKKFDNMLVKTAVEKGAVFQDDKAVVDLKITSDRAELTLEDGSHIQTDLVIGADGVYSIVARKTGLFTKHEYICPCVVEEFPLDAETMDKLYTHKRFCHIHLKPYGLAGYGWVFPKKIILT